MTTSAPDSLSQLAERYDPEVFELRRNSTRVRLAGAGPEPLDAVLDCHTAKLVAADTSQRPDALLSADEPTWASIASDVRGGMAAFRSGRLRVRHDLHLHLELNCGHVPQLERPRETHDALRRFLA